MKTPSPKPSSKAAGKRARKKKGDRTVSPVRQDSTSGSLKPAVGPAPQKQTGPGPLEWSRRRRIVASILILFHLTAVFISPCAWPPPSSELERGIGEWYLPYLQTLYINHGYRFFAPNPGPSHVVRYELEMSDGEVITGKFPDLQRHWPRLLYHRHFMLSETVFSGVQLITDPPPADAPAEVRRQYKRDANEARLRAQPLLEAIGWRLMEEHGAVGVKLFVQQHEIPTPEQIRAGIDINDERFFRTQPLGEMTAEGKWDWAQIIPPSAPAPVIAPLAPPSAIRQEPLLGPILQGQTPRAAAKSQSPDPVLQTPKENQGEPRIEILP